MKRLLLALLIWCVSWQTLWAAFSAATIWEVRNGGSDSANGGGFDPGAANFATDLACDTNTGNTNSPVVSSAGYDFVSGDVGAWIFIKSGTNWTPGYYEITSVASNKATLKAAVGEAYLAADLMPQRRNTVAGCATTATPTGGTWGIDYTQRDTPQVSATDIAIASTTTFTSATLAATSKCKNLIGNILILTNANGSGATLQRYLITATSGTTVTVDKTFGVSSGSGLSGALGGAMSTPGGAAGAKSANNVGGNSVFIKYHSTPYNLGTGTANTSGQKVLETLIGSQTQHSYWVGYDADRMVLTTDANKAKLIITGASTTGFGIPGITTARNIEVDADYQSASTCFTFAGNYNSNRFIRCHAKKFKTAGFATTGYSLGEAGACIDCSATLGYSGANAFTMYGNYYNCEAYANDCTSFAYGMLFMKCLSYNNTGSNGFGFGGPGNSATRYVNCVAYGNSQHGFCVGYGGYGGLTYVNCIAYNNGGYGWQSNGENANAIFFKCAGGKNTSGNFYTPTSTYFPAIDWREFFDLGDLGTNGPWVAPGSGNFNLDSAGSQYATLKGTGYPSSWPVSTATAGYPDIGLTQHQDAGGSSGSPPFSIGIGN